VNLTRSEFDDSGTHIALRAEVRDPRTDMPSLREMKISIDTDGAHTIEVLAPGPGNMMFTTKKFQFTKTSR
jgi:hypothetical protein